MSRRTHLPQALESARLKLKRANLHANIAKRETGLFFDRNVDYTIRLETDPQQDLSVGNRVRLRLVVDEGMPPLPDSYAARFGDAIHNYRCVLDHIAWQLVCHGLIPTPDRPELVQFPIYDSRVSFRKQRARRLPGVRYKGGPIEFIERRHRYKRGKATNELLLRLSRLSNTDKHRSLHLAVSALAKAHHAGTFTRCRPILFEGVPGPAPKLEPGAVMAYLTVEATGPNASVDMQHALAVYVALEDGSNLIDVLAETRTEVTEILYAPEIAAAF